MPLPRAVVSRGEAGVAEHVAGLVEGQQQPWLERAGTPGGAGLGLVQDRRDQGGEVRREPVALGVRGDDAQGAVAVEQVGGGEAPGLDGGVDAGPGVGVVQADGRAVDLSVMRPTDTQTGCPYNG